MRRQTRFARRPGPIHSASSAPAEWLRSALVRAAAAAMSALVLCQMQASAQPVSDVQVSADGLHRIDPSIVDDAWLRPDADLSQYTDVFVMPTVVLFRNLPAPSHSAWSDSGRTTFPVDERMQQHLRDAFGESFHAAMAGFPDYASTDRLGRYVLLVQAYLTDVATGLPPQLPGANVGPVRWLWEGNLILELRDSMSDQALLRIFSRQRVNGPIEAERIWSLAPQVTQRWSKQMIDRLSSVLDLYPSRLWRMQERAQGGASALPADGLPGSSEREQ